MRVEKSYEQISSLTSLQKIFRCLLCLALLGVLVVPVYGFAGELTSPSLAGGEETSAASQQSEPEKTTPTSSDAALLSEGTEVLEGVTLQDEQADVEGQKSLEEKLPATAPSSSTPAIKSILESDSAQESRDATLFAGGAGTFQDPYVIGDITQLKAFRDSVNAGNAYAGQYIKLSGTSFDLSSETWIPIGYGVRSGASLASGATPFEGVFDGGDLRISGLSITATSQADQALGLFGAVKGGVVKNLNLEGVVLNVPSNKLAGAVCGVAFAGAVIEGCTVSGEVNVGDGAGVVGRILVEGSIRSCTNNATVVSELSGGAAAGIVSKAYYTEPQKDMTIEACQNTGSISSVYTAGGIAGLSAANIKNCANTGHIQANGVSAGGIVGEQTNAGFISGNINHASVSTQGSGGGIVGWIRYQNNASYTRNEIVTVEANQNYGNIQKIDEVTSLGFGGIVGTVYNAALIQANENHAGTIAGGTFAAGIAGGLQEEKANLFYDAQNIQVINNLSSTPLESITGACTDKYAYNNKPQAGSPFVVRNNIQSAEEQIGSVTAQRSDGSLIGTYDYMKDALEAVQDYSNALITCEAGKRILMGSNHPNIYRSLTIEGNGATIVLSQENPTGEATFSIESYASLREDATLTINNLKNATVWGERSSAKNGTTHSFTLFMNNCDSVDGFSGQRVYLSGISGTNDLTLTECDFKGAACAVYSNAAGSLTVNNCTFTSNEGSGAININTKALSGSMKVAIRNSQFMDCGIGASDSLLYAAPVRFVNSGDASLSASLEGCTFSYGEGRTPANGDLLLGDGRQGITSNYVCATLQKTSAQVQIQNPGDRLDAATNKGRKVTVGADQVVTLSNREAAIGDVVYASLAEALLAAQDGETVTVLQDIEVRSLIAKKTEAEVTLDLNNKTVTAVDTRAIDVQSGALTIKNGTLSSNGKAVADLTGKSGAAGGTGAYGTLSMGAGSTGVLTLMDCTLINGRPWGLNVKVSSEKAIANLFRVTVVSSYGGGIEVAGGTANIKESTFTQTGYFDHCSSNVSVSGGGTLNVEGLKCTTDGWAIYVFNSGGTITAKNGDFAGQKGAVAVDAIDGVFSTVNVEGGRYWGQFKKSGKSENVTISLKGGIFGGIDESIVKGSVAPQFECVANTDSVTKDRYPLAVRGLPYTVTYKYQGDVPSAAPALPASSTVFYGSSYTAAASPILEGYTFSGWSPASIASVEGDITAVGSWLAKNDANYTVHYVLEKSGRKLAGDKVVSGRTFGATYSESALSLSGYTVVGDASQKIVADRYGKELTFTYRANEASVVFEENGGSSVSDRQGHTGDTILDRAMPSSRREGYAFVGWFDNEACAGQALTELPAVYPVGITKYWAKWNRTPLPDSSNIQVEGDPGSAMVSDETVVAVAKQAESVLAEITAGAEPRGMTHEEAQSIANLIEGVDPHDVAVSIGVKAVPLSIPKPGEKEVLEHAINSGEVLEAYFDLSVLMTVKVGNKEAGAHLSEVGEPLLIGLSVDPSIIAGKGVRVAHVHEGVVDMIVPQSVDRTKGVVMIQAQKFSTFALATSKTMTVSFDSNGGSLIEAQQVDFGKTVKKPSNPVFAGHTFVGWYTDAAFTYAYTFETPIENNLSLYAKWTVAEAHPSTPVVVGPEGGSPSNPPDTTAGNEYGDSKGADALVQQVSSQISGTFAGAKPLVSTGDVLIDGVVTAGIVALFGGLIIGTAGVLRHRRRRNHSGTN